MQELSNNPNILEVSNSSAIPGNQGGDRAFRLEGTSNYHIRDLRQMWSDYDFVNTYKMQINKGRFFSREHPSDTTSIVVNQAVVNLFGIKDPIGKNLIAPAPQGDQKFKIIGVLKDFNYESLHQEIRPLVMYLYKDHGYGSFISVRIKPYNFQSTITYLENTWKKFAGNQAFDYNFLDQNLAHLYISDQRTSKIASIFSILAIFIACLGLLGLASFVTEQRTKEIGIRKVLGASIPSLLFMLSKEFLKWVLIANIIAWPVAYYVMNNWLNNFAYKVFSGF